MKNLISGLKHFFIPHEHNDYRPHVLREASVAVMLAIVLGIFVSGLGSKLLLKYTNIEATVLPAVLVDLANTDRLAQNEHTLRINPLLQKAAEEKAADMAAKSYFAHTSPEGVTPWHWLDQVGYSFIYAGENLAIDFSESNDVETAWMNSPGHRANLLNKNYTEIGIATKDGVYQGQPTTYVVQFFGMPSNLYTEPEIVPKKTTALKTTIITSVPAKKAVPVKTPSVSPSVKGESVTNTPVVIVAETNGFIGVKNTAVPDENIDSSKELSLQKTPITYSHWYDRFIINPGKTLQIAYTIVIGFVLMSLLLMLSFEVRRRHAKHIGYAILLIAIVIALMYINAHFFHTTVLVS